MTTYTFIPVDRSDENGDLTYRLYFNMDGTTPRSLAVKTPHGRSTILFPEIVQTAIRKTWENAYERYYLDPELHKWFFHADLPLDPIVDVLGDTTLSFRDTPKKFLRVLFNLARRVYLLSPKLQEAYPTGLPLDWPGFKVPFAGDWKHFSIDTATSPGLTPSFIDMWPTRHHGLAFTSHARSRAVLLRYADDLVWRHETDTLVKTNFNPDTTLDVADTALEISNMLPESVSFESVRDGLVMLLANNT